MNRRKTFVDYVTWDHLIEGDTIPENIQAQLTKDLKTGNKLRRESHEQKGDGFHTIGYKGDFFKVPEEGHEIRDGGNVHTAMITQRVWSTIFERNGNYIGATNSTQAPVSRDGFWIDLPGHRNPSLGGDYHKETIARVIQDEEDFMTAGGRIYSELWTPIRNPEVERMVIPSSQCLDELKEGLKQKAVFLSANEDELEVLVVDTQSIDWKSEDSIKGFAESLLPKERKDYKSPTLLLGLEIGNMSMGVYGFEGKRIIAIAELDFEFADKLVENVEGLSKPQFLGGRGDTQAGAKDMAENFFAHTEMTVKNAVSTALAASYASSAIVHRRKQPNIRGFETKLDPTYQWIINPQRERDFITQYIEY